MKKLIICYFASIGTLLMFTLGLLMNAIPFAVLMFAAFTACMLWFADIIRQEDRKVKRAERRRSRVREYYSIDIPLDDDEADEPEAQDKPAAKLRPGSRPSVTYLKMIEERGNNGDHLRREA